MKKKPIIIGALIIFFTIFIIIVIGNYQEYTSFKYENAKADDLKPKQQEQDIIQKRVYDDAKQQVEGNSTEKREIANEFPENDKTLSELVNIMDSDIILGDIEAPITMIEYASLSCPHCSYFVRDAFPKLNQEYIKTGKVRFIYRDFPLNQQALAAGVVAKCYANKKTNDNDKVKHYYDILKTFFKMQDSWAFDHNYESSINKLGSIAKIHGINEDEFNKCLEDKTIQEEILFNRMQAGKELDIRSTPTFFINGIMSSGFTDYLKLKNIIESELTKAKKSD